MQKDSWTGGPQIRGCGSIVEKLCRRAHSSQRQRLLDRYMPVAHNVLTAWTWPASRIFPRQPRKRMPEFLRHPLLQAALWFAAILLLLALAIMFVRKWRGGAAEDQQNASELLTKFRELHLRGGLSDDEYRTIKTKLAARIDAELNDTNETG